MKLRISKACLSITAATFIALVYVHQQVEVVKLSYAIDNKERKAEDMLDRKRALEYNINGLAAPTRLEKALYSQRIDIAFPKRSQVVMAHPKAEHRPKNVSMKETAIEREAAKFSILDIFGLMVEAQAREK